MQLESSFSYNLLDSPPFTTYAVFTTETDLIQCILFPISGLNNEGSVVLAAASPSYGNIVTSVCVVSKYMTKSI